MAMNVTTDSKISVMISATPFWEGWEHSTFNIEHSTFNGERARWEGWEHSTFNPDESRAGIEH
jgi:hypothetical protein